MTMRKSVWILVVAVTLLSCAGNDDIEEQIAAFREETIVLPELVKVEHREISEGKPEESQLKMIIYNDSLECSSCKIMHMEDVKDLYELMEEYPGLGIYTIFSPRQLEYDGTMVDLMRLNYPYALYVDTKGVFEKANPGLPDDKRFHSFLLDRDGHPVFIGKPAASEQLWMLFKEVLANLEANGGVYVEPEER